MHIWIRNHLVHRTRNVNYQVLKGMTLEAQGGFFIIWSHCDLWMWMVERSLIIRYVSSRK